MLQNIKITGKILLLSGLHIGGSDAGVKIGGVDTPVIKNPISGLPYIPGSSLKGKTRFLLEHYYGVVESGGDVSKPIHNGKKNEVAVIYGHLEHDRNPTKPTRVVFRDSNIVGAITNLDDLSEDNINKMLKIKEASQTMNSLFVELKTEVSIDRMTGTVKQRGGGLRQIERVPAGTIFDFEVVLRVFEESEQNPHLEIIKQGLKLMENDALGGYGSRGSGRIKFYDLKIGDDIVNLDEVKL